MNLTQRAKFYRKEPPDQHAREQGSHTDRVHHRSRRSRGRSKITDSEEARLSEQMKLLQVWHHVYHMTRPSPITHQSHTK